MWLINIAVNSIHRTGPKNIKYKWSPNLMLGIHCFNCKFIFIFRAVEKYLLS